MTAPTPFAPGTSVALREVLHGRAWTTCGAIVVRDDDELVATWTPVGSPVLAPIGPAGAFDRTPSDQPMRWERRTWHTNDVLALARPGDPWSVRLHWTAATGRFAGWYVNVEEPRRRVADGFETMDDELDIVVDPDGSWHWKDRDLLDRWIELGVYTAADGARIREAGRRALQVVTTRASPLCDGWEAWRPDPAWGIPTTPDDWHGGHPAD